MFCSWINTNTLILFSAFDLFAAGVQRIAEIQQTDSLHVGNVSWRYWFLYITVSQRQNVQHAQIWKTPTGFAVTFLGFKMKSQQSSFCQLLLCLSLVLYTSIKKTHAQNITLEIPFYLWQVVNVPTWNRRFSQKRHFITLKRTQILRAVSSPSVCFRTTLQARMNVS